MEKSVALARRSSDTRSRYGARAELVGRLTDTTVMF